MNDPATHVWVFNDFGHFPTTFRAIEDFPYDPKDVEAACEANWRAGNDATWENVKKFLPEVQG